ncbi:MAG TPA: CoA transferase, partial [Sneathiellales bacterium]|nr:CoA transferase [Sneathiellales bacterium]
ERTGEGQYLDISLIDTYYQYQEINVQGLSLSKGAFMPRASGAQHYAAAPLGIYKGKSQPILIMGLPRQWPALCKLMGREDIENDPKFVDNGARVENQKELTKIIEDWLQSQDSDEETIKALEDARVPCAPILSAVEAINHPHLLERGTAQTITDRALGEFIIPGISFRFGDFPPLELQAPFLGEHNEDVLTRLGGMTPEKVAEMVADGALGSEPVPSETKAAAE